MSALSEQLYRLVLDLELDLDTTRGELADRVATLAQLVEENYIDVTADLDGDSPTPAQGLALARFLRPQFRPTNRDAFATVARGGFDLPDGYIRVRFPDGYEGGIARDGRTST